MKYALVLLAICALVRANAQNVTPDPIIPDGHQSRVNAVAYSTDGAYVLTGGGDGKCMIWDRASGRQLKTLKGHRQGISAVGFSPDGRFVLSAGLHLIDKDHYDTDTYFLWWDVQRGQTIKEIHASNVVKKAFLVDRGKAVIYQNQYKIVRSALNIDLPDLIVDFRGDMTVSANGRYLFTMEFIPKTIKSDLHGLVGSVYDLEKGGIVDQPPLIRTVLETRPQISAGALSNDGQQLAAKTGDRQIVLYNLATGGVVSESAMSDKLVAIKFSPDDRTLVGLSRKGQVLVRDLKRGNEESFQQDTTGDGVRALAISPDSRELLIGRGDFEARTYRLSDGRLTTRYKGLTEPIRDAGFSFDGHYLITKTSTGHEHAWSLETGAYLDTLPAYVHRAFPGKISPNGRFEVKVNNQLIEDNLGEYYSIYGDYVVLKDIQQKKDLVLFSFVDGGWMVYGSGGQMDLSQQALQDIYLVKGLQIATEPIKKYLRPHPGIFLQTITGQGASPSVVTEASRAAPDGYLTSTVKGYSSIRVQPILPVDPSPVLHIQVTNYQESAANFDIFLNGLPISKRKTKGEDLNNYVKGSTIEINLSLAPYFKDGTAWYSRDNQVEIVSYLAEQPGLAVNALRFHFRSEEHELPHLVIPTGHTQRVTGLASTADGKKLFTAADDGAVNVWDIDNQRQIQNIRVATGVVAQLKVSADGRFMIIAGGLGENDFNGMLRNLTYRLWDVVKEQKFNLSKENLTANSVFTPDGKGIILPEINQILDIASQQTRPFIAGLSNPIFSVIPACSGNKCLVVCKKDVGKGAMAIIYDLQTQKEIRRFDEPSYTTLFSATGEAWVCHDNSPKGGVMNLRYGLASQSYQVQPLRLNTFQQLDLQAISSDARFLVLHNHAGQLILVDRKMGTMQEDWLKTLNEVTSCFLPGKDQLAVGDVDGVTKVYEVPSGRLVHTFSGEVDLLTENGFNRVSDRLYLSKRGKQDAYVFNFQPGAPMQRLHHQKRLESMTISPDGRYLLTREEKGIAYLWDFNSGRLIKPYSMGDSMLVRADFTKTGSMLLTPGTITNGRYHSIIVDPETDAVKQEPGDNDWDTYSVYSAKGVAKLLAEQVSTGIDRTDGIIHIQDSHTKNTLANFIPFKSGDWIMYTDDGYFMSSRDGAKHLSYYFKGRYYTFDQFDLQFNRPDLVLARLGNTSAQQLEYYKKMYERRLHLIGYDPANFNKEKLFDAPEIGLKSEPLEQSLQKQWNCELIVHDDKYPLDRLDVRVNGVPVYGVRGLSLAEKNSQNINIPLELLLSNGKNLIECSVVNRVGVVSVPLQFSISYTGPVNQPDLYIVAIGAQKYQHSELNLAYPAKDAGDVLTMFKGAAAGAYGHVVTIPLTGDTVRLEELSRVKTALQRTKVDDQVILFYAGHGMVDTARNYFLATYDVDPERPEIRGLNYQQLEGLITDIPARNRSLWIDACYSGEYDKTDMVINEQSLFKKVPKNTTFRGGPREVSRKAVTGQISLDVLKDTFMDLRRNSGASILSAAGGYECAVEDGQWRNGVFTYCLVNGLKNKAADSNKDGVVTVSELETYLRVKVYELTNGLQKPSVRAENIDSDFVLWR